MDVDNYKERQRPLQRKQRQRRKRLLRIQRLWIKQALQRQVTPHHWTHQSLLHKRTPNHYLESKQHTHTTSWNDHSKSSSSKRTQRNCAST